MAIFVVFRVQDAAKMGAAIKREFPSEHLELGNNEWLISAANTATEVADKLGLVKNNENGSAIVFAMGGYYGRAPQTIWDWIKLKAENPSG